MEKLFFFTFFLLFGEALVGSTWYLVRFGVLITCHWLLESADLAFNLIESSFSSSSITRANCYQVVTFHFKAILHPSPICMPISPHILSYSIKISSCSIKRVIWPLITFHEMSFIYSKFPIVNLWKRTFFLKKKYFL